MMLMLTILPMSQPTFPCSIRVLSANAVETDVIYQYADLHRPIFPIDRDCDCDCEHHISSATPTVTDSAISTELMKALTKAIMTAIDYG